MSKDGNRTHNPDYKLHIEDYEPQLALKSINDSHEEASCKSEILFKDNDNYCLSKIVINMKAQGMIQRSTVLYKS